MIKRVLPRLTACVAAALAIGLALGPPYHTRDLRMPDPWAYWWAVQNFAHGRLTVTDSEMAAGQMQARLAGGRIMQYVQATPNRWALEKAPGYPLLVTPFEWMGWPRLANAALAALAALAVYAVLARWRGEWTACMGVAVLMLSPLSLMAMHQAYMDTFASGVLLAIGAALSLLCVRAMPEALPRLRVSVELLMAGWVLGWAVVVRLPNALVAGPFAIWIAWKVWRNSRPLALAFGTGFAAALAVLAIYNTAVFQHPFAAGYLTSFYRADFIWSGSGVDVAGMSTWQANDSALATVAAQFGMWAQPLWIGWPLLPLSILGWFMSTRYRMALLPGWLSGVWLLAAYAPYSGLVFFGVTRELVNPFYHEWGFYVVDRYLFPALFPITLLIVAALAKLPRWAAAGLLLLSIVLSVWLYVHALAALK